MKWTYFWFGLLDIFSWMCLILTANSGNMPFKSDRHICIHRQHIAHKVPTRYSYIRPVMEQVMTPCDGGYRLCPRRRLSYRVAYRAVIRVRIHTHHVYDCCPGWSRNSTADRECLIPLCRITCHNGGTCVAPDKCKCEPGWSGDKCDKMCLSCMPEYSEMKTIITKLTDKVEKLEEEKNFIKSNLSFLTDHYEETMATVKELKSASQKANQFIPAPKDEGHKEHTTPSIESMPARDQIGFMPYDRLASLSEQIAMLEERLEGCTCQHVGSKRGRRHQ